MSNPFLYSRLLTLGGKPSKRPVSQTPIQLPQSVRGRQMGEPHDGS